MATLSTLQPTLWRSCRALADRRRLRIFSLLVHKRSLTVSVVAQRLQLTLPVASQYLRGLEARGFLKARRVADRVYYSLSTADALRPAQLLVPALRVALRRDTASVERVFKLATAFTHPRRIEIFRALGPGGRTVGQLRALTGISRFALGRHLAKLEARGFVVSRAGSYVAARPRDGFGRALARLAGR